MLLRREAPTDLPAVRALTAAAFAAVGDNESREVPVEVPLLDALRECEGWIPELSLVAVDAEDRPIGHVVCTRADVDGAPALGLGPLSVAPGHQRAGVGSALMHAVVAAAEARGETLVALLGEPAYYGRFGFRASTADGVVAPEAEWGAYFQTRALTADGPSPQGRFRYAAPFNEL
ncbi:N-acetyltransferase [Streptomyces sp. XM4193]|uniref:GNAT family N-acetyltransferase n=1 Tax=Streptomyces sp. XM4193 TaxID=2929782 RepID=UPI001FF9B825|nr:N-acetyltransferase [Streptomyces sp. XM4193]MCK1796958.1 N-acetyltransferase [Streptomyces sp. XM4193]